MIEKVAKKGWCCSVGVSQFARVGEKEARLRVDAGHSRCREEDGPREQLRLPELTPLLSFFLPDVFSPSVESTCVLPHLNRLASHPLTLNGSVAVASPEGRIWSLCLTRSTLTAA
jgi:hypothetical protein